MQIENNHQGYRENYASQNTYSDCLSHKNKNWEDCNLHRSLNITNNFIGFKIIHILITYWQSFKKYYYAQIVLGTHLITFTDKSET